MEIKLTEEQRKLFETETLKNHFDFTFEKNKLKAYLGKDIYNSLKQAKAIVAGGMITSIFTNNEINDVDVYFRDNESLYGFAKDNLGHVVSHTKKATQYIDKVNGQDRLIQLIHYHTYDKVNEIFDTYDFTVCMGAFDFLTEEFILHKDFLKHNSQRLLRFNSGTSYPIISAIRVQKYENKGYNISKAEYIRILMTCMSLEISAYEDLKEHLGGMYGESYDRLFEDVKDEEFDLADAIERIANITLADTYFSEYKPIDYDVEAVLEDLDKAEKVVVELIDGKYRILNDKLSYFNGLKIDKTVDVSEYFKDKKFYKFVKKVNDKYFSFYDGNFEYKIGETIKADKEYVKQAYSNSRGKLFFNHKDKIMKSGYHGRDGGVLIEVELLGENVISSDNNVITATQCNVIREVPESEWKNYEVKNDNDDDFWESDHPLF